MKRCNFCDYCRCTENKEKVCIKHLVYLDDPDTKEICRGFRYSVGIKPAVFILAVTMIMFVLMIIGL